MKNIHLFRVFDTLIIAVPVYVRDPNLMAAVEIWGEATGTAGGRRAKQRRCLSVIIRDSG